MNRGHYTGKTPDGNRARAAEQPREDLAQLVKRAQEGESGAFRSLYEIYSKKILNYLFRLTGSRAVAEDLTQDTFVMAYRKIGTVKDPARFQSWLFRVAQNNAFQRFRGQKVRLESIDRDDSGGDELRELPSAGPSPEQSSLSAELEELIQQAISDLPEKYRTVFVLSAVQKMSYQEISSVVGRSLASVKSDIHRARVQVRDRIKDYLGDSYGVSG